MKHIFRLSFLIILASMITLESEAKFFGISISFEKGTKEWNSDHTKTECVGKGLCKLSFSASVGVIHPGGNGVGTLGFSDDGHFGLSLPVEIISDPYWKETFLNGAVYIGKDISLDPIIREKLQRCPAFIKAGVYSYTIEDGQVIILF